MFAVHAMAPMQLRKKRALKSRWYNPKLREWRDALPNEGAHNGAQTKAANLAIFFQKARAKGVRKSLQ